MTNRADEPDEREQRLGELLSLEHRPAYSCTDCRESCYVRQPPRHCPNCGSQDIDEASGLPGALLLNPGVEWPEDNPFGGSE